MSENRHLRVMKLRLGIFITSIIIIVSGCHQEQEKAPVFPQRIGLINDYEHVFSDLEKVALDSIARDFKARTTIELVIVTVDSSMASLDKFNSYTLQLSKHWEIGGAEKKNGILIGISSHFERVRINRGLGVKGLKDGEVRAIMDDYMFPELRKGNYFGGTKIAIDKMRNIIN